MATPGRYRRQDVFYKNVTQDGDFILLFFWRGTGICKTFLNYILACHFLLMLIHIVRKILKQLLRVKPVRNINKVMVPQERKLKYYKNLDI